MTADAENSALDMLSNDSVTVLYIEDNPVNLTLIKKVIEKKTAFRFISAVEPVSGLELAIGELPDLILLDIFLPVMDGYEVMKRLQENDSTRDIPVIALSANAMKSDIEKGLSAGFKDYLPKPIDMPYFLQLVAEVLKQTLSVRDAS